MNRLVSIVAHPASALEEDGSSTDEGRSGDVPFSFTPSIEARDAAAARQSGLLKPPGALGALETLAVHYAAVRGHLTTPEPPRFGLAVFAADHGVTVEGVSAYPKEVTRGMVAAMVSGVAAVSVLARAHDVELSVVDVGVLAAVGDAIDVLVPGRGVRYAEKRIRRGTANLRTTSAMSLAEVKQAIGVGSEEALAFVARGASVVGVGEVGIGNTTAAACLVCALTGETAERIVGRGTGVDEAGLTRKRRVVTEAVARLRKGATGLTVLSEVGGLELAAMVGFMLTAVQNRCLVVLDGFLAQAAALVASEMAPGVRAGLVASHVSAETGSSIALEALGLEPLLSLGMRLGEGTGAVLGMGLVADAIRLEREMGTLAGLGLA